MNKLRERVIDILETVEGHIEDCKSKKKKPFDNEEWYHIEDEVYDILYEHIVGREDTDTDPLEMKGDKVLKVTLNSKKYGEKNDKSN